MPMPSSSWPQPTMPSDSQRSQAASRSCWPTVPEASTPRVEVVLLQADYQRAESLMIHWLEEPADQQPLDRGRGHPRPHCAAAVGARSGAGRGGRQAAEAIEAAEDRAAARRPPSSRSPRQQAIAVAGRLFRRLVELLPRRGAAGRDGGPARLHRGQGALLPRARRDRREELRADRGRRPGTGFDLALAGGDRPGPGRAGPRAHRLPRRRSSPGSTTPACRR